MKIFETIQRAENGGWPVENGNPDFHHGQGVYIIDRNEFLELLTDLVTAQSQHYPKLEELLEFLRKAGGYTARDGVYVFTRYMGSQKLQCRSTRRNRHHQGEGG